MANPEVGSNPRLINSSNTLFAFDTGLAASYDFGATWMPVSDVSSECKALTSFVNGSTIGFFQPAVGGVVKTFYTVTGTRWLESETLDLNQKTAVDAAHFDQTLFIATIEGWLYAWSQKVDSFQIDNHPQAIIREIAATPVALVVRTSEGLFQRNHTTRAWVRSDPPSHLDVAEVTVDITVHGSSLFAATDMGVFEYDWNTSVWKGLGYWPAEIAIPQVVAIAADNARLVAMCTTEQNRHQLYRLDNADTVWTATAYEIPMDAPSIGNDALVLDGGWAITYQSSAEEPDSTGLYAYNLNDFTSVSESLNRPVVQQYPTGLFINTGWPGISTGYVMSLQGRLLTTFTANEGEQFIPLSISESISLVLLVGENGQVERRVLLRSWPR